MSTTRLLCTTVMTSREHLIRVMGLSEQHAKRLQLGLQRTAPLWPITAQQLADISDEDVGFLDMVTNRFELLQDALEHKVFPVLLMVLQEDITRASCIDKLNLLERLGVITSAQFWIDLREIRNTMAHEYPDDPESTVTGLNAGHTAARQLLDLYDDVKRYIAAHVKFSS